MFFSKVFSAKRDFSCRLFLVFYFLSSSLSLSLFSAAAASWSASVCPLLLQFDVLHFCSVFGADFLDELTERRLARVLPHFTRADSCKSRLALYSG